MSEETKKVSRRKYIAAGGAVAAAAVIGGAAYYLWGQPGAPAPTTPPPTTPPVTTPPKTTPPATTPPPTTPPKTTPPPTTPPATTPPVTTPPVTTLRVLLESAPESNALHRAGIPAYEQLNPNIKFTVDVIPREVFDDTAIREIVQQTGKYDLLITHASLQTIARRTKGWVIGLEKMGVVDETEARKQYKSELVDICKTPETGEFYMWPPLYWNTMGLYYRKDLFNDPTEKDNFKSQYGYDLAVPRTWDQLRDVAEFFTRPPNLYGFWLDGIDWAHYHVWGTFMLSQGVWFTDEYGVHPDFLSEKSIRALEFCKTMSQFCPPGWQSEDFFTGEGKLKAGNLAMHLNWQYCYADFFNPDKVKPPVLNNVEQAFLPVAPDTGYYKSYLSYMCLAMFSASPYKQQVAAFLKWMDSFEAGKIMAKTGEIFMPARKDVQNDPEVQNQIKLFPQNWLGFEEMKLHPWGPDNWNAIAAAFYAPSSVIYLDFMNGNIDAETALQREKDELERLLATI